MDVIFVMLLHGLPVFLTPFFSDSEKTLYFVAGISGVIALSTGNPVFILADLFAIAIALYFAVNLLRNPEQEAHSGNKFFERVAQELSSGNTIDSIWFRCIDQSAGNREKAQALYIKYRIKDLEEKETRLAELNRQYIEKQKQEQENHIREVQTVRAETLKDEIIRINEEIVSLKIKLYLALLISFALTFGIVYLGLLITLGVEPTSKYVEYITSAFEHKTEAKIILWTSIIIFFFTLARISESVPPAAWVYAKYKGLRKKGFELQKEWGELNLANIPNDKYGQIAKLPSGISFMLRLFAIALVVFLIYAALS